MLKTIKEQLTKLPVKGFLDSLEAEALFHFARQCAPMGACLELGSYCGLSSVYLGSACKTANGVLYAVDHHSGSEEHQVGELYHDQTLIDKQTNSFDTFRHFQATLRFFDLQENVIPIVTDSKTLCRFWQEPLALLFIDGGHGVEATQHDFLQWPAHIMTGGYLLAHDIFSEPKDGGQAPYDALQCLLEKGQFEFIQRIQSMEIYRKL